MSDKHWFWHSRILSWFEEKLLTFTTWFWNRRHPPAIKPRIAPTLDEIPKENKTKKRAPRKNTKNQKSDWQIKE
jgi:hypothetical protein